MQNTSVPARDLTPSTESQALAKYYRNLQADLLTRGLLRQDGGGPDTAFRASDLARNFEQIVFYDEYAQGSSNLASARRGGQGLLRRWQAPVRMRVSFGDHVPAPQRAKDEAEVRKFAARLARITKHPISTTNSDKANFHVLFMSTDDAAQQDALIRQAVPRIGSDTLKLFRTMPRSIHCLVVAFSDTQESQVTSKAVALIRSEHPDLLRKSCIHEELSQGLGLANDSPAARPSIFNDDDEFALLTTHDEYLLNMLYDSRLSVGMDADTARPTVMRLAREKTGEDDVTVASVE